MPDVSVLIPTFNSRRWIEGALRSVLDQAGVSVEVIVSDDGSSDGTPELLARWGDPRVVAVRTQGKGIAAGLNSALARASGEFLARCDHDDLYPPGRLARQVAFLRDHPEFGAVCGQLETADERGRLIAEMGSGDRDQELTAELRRGHLRTHNGTWLWRAEVGRRIGPFRILGVTGEDNDFQYRFAEASRVWYQAAVAYRFRLRDSSTSHAQPTADRLHAMEVAKLLQRQRLERHGPDDLDLGLPLPPVPEGPSPPLVRAREEILGILIGSSWQELARGRRVAAVRQAARAVLREPARRAAWRNMLALCAKAARPGAAAPRGVELPTYTVRAPGAPRAEEPAAASAER